MAGTGTTETKARIGHGSQDMQPLLHFAWLGKWHGHLARVFICLVDNILHGRDARATFPIHITMCNPGLNHAKDCGKDKRAPGTRSCRFLDHRDTTEGDERCRARSEAERHQRSAAFAKMLRRAKGGVHNLLPAWSQISSGEAQAAAG